MATIMQENESIKNELIIEKNSIDKLKANYEGRFKDQEK